MSLRRVGALLTAAALISAVATSTAEAAPLASPCPAGQACLVVTWTGPSAGSQVVTADDIDAWHDVVNVGYPVKPARNISPHSEFIGAGLSVGALLGHLTTPIPVAAVHFTSTHNRLGQLSALDQADLADPSPFMGGLLPVVYVVGANDAIGYVRPMRNGQDVNSPDVFQTDSHGVLRLTVHLTGSLLTPAIHASSASTPVGAPVRLWLTFAQPPGGRIFTTWDFGDGSPQQQAARPVHRWTTEGTFAVVAQVRTSDGSLGESAPLVVTVGPPHHALHPGRPGSGQHPDPHHPVTGPTPGDGHHAGGPTPSRPSSSSGPGQAGTSHQGGQLARDGTARHPATHLTLVSGTTITAASAGGSPRQGATSSAAAARSGSPMGGTVPTWVVLLLVVATLVGVGARSERLPRRPSDRRLAT